MAGMKQRQPFAAPAPDPAWKIVRRWPGLRGESKLAWEFLWTLSNRGGQRVPVRAAEIGADQGTSGDAGDRALKNLVSVGLAVVVDRDRQRGLWTLELPPPADVARARHVEWDGQHELPFEDDGSYASEQPTSESWGTAVPHASDSDCSPANPGAAGVPAEARAEARAEAPALPRPLTLTSGSSCAHDTLTSKTLKEVYEGSEVTKPPVGGTARASATAPGTAAGAMAATVDAFLANLPTIEGQIERAESLMRYIVGRVNCADMHDHPALIVAWAVLEGRLPAKDLSSMFFYLDRARASGTLLTKPSQYFNGGMKRHFFRRGIEWGVIDQPNPNRPRQPR